MTTPAFKPVSETLQKRNLRYFFRDDELLELARKLAEKSNDTVILEDEKSRATKDYASRIKTVQNEVAAISQRVREGYEFRDVEVRVRLDAPDPGHKTITRLDTGEATVERMTPEEKQMRFAIVDDNASDPPPEEEV